MNELDADPPPTASDALEIIRREQARTAAAMTPNLTLMIGLWGVAWLAGGIVQFGYLRGLVSGATAGWTGIALLVVAAAVSIVLGVRSGQGVRSSSGVQGAMYGWSWSIAMIAMGVVVAATADELPVALRPVLIPALFVFVVGVLYLAGGAIWRDTVQYATGVWIVVVAVAAVLVGAPSSALVLGVGGGGALLAAAAAYAAQGRRE